MISVTAYPIGSLKFTTVSFSVLTIVVGNAAMLWRGYPAKSITLVFYHYHNINICYMDI